MVKNKSKTSQKENKNKPTKKHNKILTKILTTLYKSRSQSQLRKMLCISKQNLDYYIKKLSSSNLIDINKLGRYNILTLTEKGKEFQIKNFDQKAVGYYNFLTKTRIHNYQIQIECTYVNFPYLKKAAKQHKLGKAPYYILKNSPMDMTLKFTNTKKLIIYIHKKEIEPTIRDLAIFNKELFKRLFYIFKWLEYKGIAIVDPTTIKDNYIETANKTTEGLDSLTSQQHKVTEFLDRKAEGFISKRNDQAKAWLDKSEKVCEIETNDIEYERKLLLMPELTFNISKMVPKQMDILDKFTSQLQLHLNAINDIRIGIQEFNKTTVKLNKTIDKLGKHK